MVLRLAMWSGPRNISTALMRSWENRPDTIVCDEPLYAYYLTRTRLPHPGADEVLAAHDADWDRVLNWLTGPLPQGKTVFYQKQMAHHLLPEIPLTRLSGLTHCFLIRDPQEMLTSLLEFLPEPTLADTGLPQQLQLWERVRAETGINPPVLDARDMLQNPRAMLTLFCDRLGIPFQESMLCWPPGRRETDGVWARYWYAKVEQSTTFAPYQAKSESVPETLQPLLAACQPLYQKLHSVRLLATGG